MTVRGRRGTPAMRAEQVPQPARTHTQDELRSRRRQVLPVVLLSDFSLADELAAICCPLAPRLSLEPNLHAYQRNMDELVDAVHGLVHVVVGVLAERDAHRKAAHLTGDTRVRSIRQIVDLAQRPAAPTITADDLTSGTWSARLIAHVEPYSGALGDLLGRAATADPSDRLVRALQDVDSAALALERRLDRAEAARASRTLTPRISECDRARAELAALGIDLEGAAP